MKTLKKTLVGLALLSTTTILFAATCPTTLQKAEEAGWNHMQIIPKNGNTKPLGQEAVTRYYKTWNFKTITSANVLCIYPGSRNTQTQVLAIKHCTANVRLQNTTGNWKRANGLLNNKSQRTRTYVCKNGRACTWSAQ